MTVDERRIMEDNIATLPDRDAAAIAQESAEAEDIALRGQEYPDTLGAGEDEDEGATDQPRLFRGYEVGKRTLAVGGAANLDISHDRKLAGLEVGDELTVTLRLRVVSAKGKGRFDGDDLEGLDASYTTNTLAFTIRKEQG